MIIFLLDAIDFHSPVKLGQVMHLSARATFTSSRSMEIEVVVDAKDYISGKKTKSKTKKQNKKKTHTSSLESCFFGFLVCVFYFPFTDYARML